MRISDWSSDVCSSDLGRLQIDANLIGRAGNVSCKGDERLHAGRRIGIGPRDIHVGIKAVADIESRIVMRKIRILKPEKLTLRSEEHTSELQSLMRISYAVFCLKKKNRNTIQQYH